MIGLNQFIRPILDHDPYPIMCVRDKKSYLYAIAGVNGFPAGEITSEIIHPVNDHHGHSSIKDNNHDRSLL